MDLLVSTADSDEPRGSVLVAHGFGEHTGRYSYLAKRLAGAGFDVYRFDFEGHGPEAGEGAGKVDVARLIAQHLEARGQVLRLARTRELCLFGHSMGGLVALASSILDPSNVQAVTVTGPALRPNPQVPVFVAKLASVVAKFRPGVETVEIDPELLSTDPDEVEAYRDDPLVFHGKVPLRSAASMIVQGAQAIKNAGLVSRPTLILHSIDDQICQLQGSREFVENAPQHMREQGSVQLREVEGAKHDLIHEYYTTREETVVQLLNWYQQWS